MYHGVEQLLFFKRSEQMREYVQTVALRTTRRQYLYWFFLLFLCRRCLILAVRPPPTGGRLPSDELSYALEVGGVQALRAYFLVFCGADLENTLAGRTFRHIAIANIGVEERG